MHKISEPAPNCPACGGEVSKKVSAPAVHGGSAGHQSSPTAPAAAHGCGAGACGCRH
ncbi:MAG: zinc ribbon domain-containing protein [Methylotetracoccus sp.]|nr:zinc ribbon domain-containing protein [Methylotetracoccus sp.]